VTTLDDDVLDYTLVRRLQARVADRMTTVKQEREAAGHRDLEADDERQVALSLIRQAVLRHTQELISAGRDLPDPGYDRRLMAAVDAAMYGAGELDELLRDGQVENVDINGCDEVWVTYADHRGKVQGRPVAATDDDLIGMVQTLAGYAGLNARPFTPANPQLDLRLPDGSRLSAVMSATERPVVSVRRNRFPQMFLPDLVRLGTVDEQTAAFLRAAVLARANIIIAGATDAGKALDLDTRVPTPTGWTTMGELQCGDVIFDDMGAPCRVLEAHPVRLDRECFEVQFSDGQKIVADADHLWAVSRRCDREGHWYPPDRKPGRERRRREMERLRRIEAKINAVPDEIVAVSTVVGAVHKNLLFHIARTLDPVGRDVKVYRRLRRGKEERLRWHVNAFSRQLLLKELIQRRAKEWEIADRPSTVVLATKEMVDSLKVGSYWNYRVPVAGPLRYGRKAQELDPYALGLWLADGATFGAVITTADPEIVAEFERLGHPCRKVGRRDPYNYGVGNGFRTGLRHAGVRGNKHIPPNYLHGDVEQRRALLQGLMDGDGTVEPNGSVSYTSTSKILADHVRELVVGLGYAPRQWSRPAILNGKVCGTAHRIAWATRDPVFRLPRKLDMQQLRVSDGAAARSRRLRRSIVSIREVESRPVRCITVDSPSKLYLVGDSCIPTHNTTLLRSLVNVVQPRERIITVERALELGLRRHPELHADVVEFEEVLPDADGNGGITIAELVRRTRRHNPSRVLVGEVLGPEVVEMLSAMSQGNNGSLSTIHARDAADVFHKLATYAAQHEHLAFEVTHALIASSIDFVVYIRKNPLMGDRRCVAEILEVTGLGEGRVARSAIFTPSPVDGRAVRAADVSIMRSKQLAAQGYDDTAAAWDTVSLRGEGGFR